MLDIVKYILYPGIPILQDVLLVALFVRGLILRKRRKESKHAKLVSLSPLVLWVGALCGGLLSIPATLTAVPGQWPDGVWYVFAVGVLACLAMMLAYCNETVTYDKETFTAGNLFGIKRTYDYGNITGIARKGGDTILHCGRRRIRLDTMSTGGDELIAYADKGYFKRHGKYIPVYRAKIDPMNGNLDTPWLYFVIYLFSVIFFVALAALMLGVIKPADDSVPSKVFEMDTSFSTYDRTKNESGTLLLYAPGYEKPFAISWLSGYEISIPDPETLCRGDTYHITVSEASDRYYIYTLANDEEGQIISAYDHNTAYRNTQLVWAIGLLVFGILGSVFSIFGILVGRHPEKYPRWFRGLFYKNSAWTMPYLKDLYGKPQTKTRGASPGRQRGRKKK